MTRTECQCRGERERERERQGWRDSNLYYDEESLLQVTIEEQTHERVRGKSYIKPQAVSIKFDVAVVCLSRNNKVMDERERKWRMCITSCLPPEMHETLIKLTMLKLL